MRTERGFPDDGYTMQCADGVLLSCTLEICMILQTSVTPISSINKFFIKEETESNQPTERTSSSWKTALKKWRKFQKRKPFFRCWNIWNFFLRFYVFIFRERGREGERRGNIKVASRTPLNGDLACNPGMCPDWESNQ